MERKRERQGRRTPPPSVTGAERVYFNRQVAEGADLTLGMRDGEELSGKLIEHDRDQLTLENDGRRVVIRKSEIRFIAE